MALHHHPRKNRKRHTVRTCKGKVRYRDESEAQRFLRVTRGCGREKVPVRVYECPHCKGWHLTSRETW